MRSPPLYSSSIHQLLVLQEDEEFLNDHPSKEARNDRLDTNSETPVQKTAVTEQKPSQLQPRNTPAAPDNDRLHPWRITDRIKTTNGLLVLCLNMGVDPPDSFRPAAGRPMHCWLQPNIENPVKSLQHIASALKTQYERCHSKARYKIAPDPTVEEIKRLCVHLRRAAKNDRVLFHYNGYGVPRPSGNGDLWFYNHNYTQYIPYNLTDIHAVLGSPALYIFDTNSAGAMLQKFGMIISQDEARYAASSGASNHRFAYPNHRGCVFLGACSEGESLPTSTALPADLFTSCLTTPIKTALRWFSKKSLVPGITEEMLEKIPGSLSERKTPLGELQWIFTAITDTIAWNVLPRDRFKHLYRGELMLANLMRNFLLANRIMHFYGCRPVSHPTVPDTHNHHLWDSFELAIENLLAQLPRILSDLNEDAPAKRDPVLSLSTSLTPPSAQPRAPFVQEPLSEQQIMIPSVESHRARIGNHSNCSSHRLLVKESTRLRKGLVGHRSYRYKSNPFFEHQLKAFDAWLTMGLASRDPPEELPITLHMLLNRAPTDRLRTLQLLSRYIQTGPDAVGLCLSVGVLPYVLSILKAVYISGKQALVPLEQELVFIWGRVMALDKSVRSDLIAKKSEVYFIKFLGKSERSEERVRPVYLAVALYVLSVVAVEYSDRLRANQVLEVTFNRLSHASSFVRRWACLCITEVVRHSSQDGVYKTLNSSDFIRCLEGVASLDVAPDVRAAAISALAAVMNCVLRDLLDGVDEMPSGSPKAQSSVPELPDDEVSGGAGPESVALSSSSSAFANVQGNESEASNEFYSRGNAAEGPLPSEQSFYYDITAPFTPEEQEALRIGLTIAEGVGRESSVLVRREISIALSNAVLYAEKRFVQAAYFADIMGFRDKEAIQTSSGTTDKDMCEAVYRQMWTSLSELAYDPHPVVAAMARGSYDVISDLVEHISRPSQFRFDRTMESMDAVPHPQTHSSFPTQELNTSEEIEARLGMGSNELSKEDSNAALDSSSQRGQRATPHILPVARDEGKLRNPAYLGGEKALLKKPENEVTDSLQHSFHSWQGIRETSRNSNIRFEEIGKGKIHVRSASGSFDLNVPSRIPMISRIHRTASANHMPVFSSPLREVREAETRHLQTGVNMHSIHRSSTSEIPRTRSHMQLVRGIESLARTFTHQLHLGTLRSPGNARPGNISGIFGDRDNALVTQHTPPRPRQRSRSYQILNNLDFLSNTPNPNLTIPSKGSWPRGSTTTKRISDFAPLDEKERKDVHPRSHLSEAKSATFSLFEWSAMLISRVQFDSTSTDYTLEIETTPRYAALWNKFSKSEKRIPLEESLSAFARVQGDDFRSRIYGDNEKEFKFFRELNVYMLGAGGGAVTAMAFLPRDSGMGDDHLIATGDSHGSVGVYDIESGLCQGSFGVPSPPGIPEVGISSILCLNDFAPHTHEDTSALSNSRSALILTGACDGRVAVFKSDEHCRKYRIMSTFQASGKSFWSTVGTMREYQYNTERHTSRRPVGGKEKFADEPISAAKSLKFPSRLDTSCAASLNSESELALSFDFNTSYLAAAGCEREIVRLWDLSREQCVWVGQAVQQGVRPTSVAILKQWNPKIAAVGCTDGSIHILDSRLRIRSRVPLFRAVTCGTSPIISIGSGVQGGKTVVAANRGGKLFFLDPRRSGKEMLRSSVSSQSSKVASIDAHSTRMGAMSVHPSGRYVATGSTGRHMSIFGPDQSGSKMVLRYEAPGSPYPHKSAAPSITSLAFQHESKMLAVGCDDSSVVVYGEPLSSFP